MPLNFQPIFAGLSSAELIIDARNKKHYTMKKIFRYFLQGLLLVAPAGITIYIVYWVFDLIDGPIRNAVDRVFHLHIPGIGLVVTFTVIALLGWIGQSFLFKPLGRFLEKIFEKAPILKMIYTSITDFINAFVGEKKKFTKPVLVKVNLISNLEKVGFITSEDLTDLGVKDKVCVLFPHSYNWSGEMFIVPKEHITLLNLPPGEVMKFALTGGVTRV
jgi:uncharacterized membrane protein